MGMLTRVQKGKLDLMRAGVHVVLSDEDLDAIEATDEGAYLATSRNPLQVGTRDSWVGWLVACDQA